MDFSDLNSWDLGMNEREFNVVYSYTRTQALEDGVLIDVSKQAKEAGFKVPVAISDYLYNGYIVPSKELEDMGQSVEGRLHDVLMMTLHAAKDRLVDNRVYFEVLFMMGDGPKFAKVGCVAIVDPGDDGEPVMTICRPEDE